MRRRPILMRADRTSLVAAAAAMLAVAGVAGASALPTSSGLHKGSQRGSLVLSGTPSNPVANLRTHTLYVPLQSAHHAMDIIDTSHCNMRVVSGCRIVGRAQAGKSPLDAVIDEKTDTIYAIDGPGVVSVLDGGRCNAKVRTHCGVLAKIKTGGFDVAGVLNPRTHTLYVAAPSGDVFVINVARCNAQTTRGCQQRVRKVKDTPGPDAIDADLATNTIYAANSGNNGDGHTVSLIDGAACNGRNGRGCGRKPRTISVGTNPFWLTVDQAADTVYVANFDDGTVSVINGAACNSSVTAGCHRRPRAVSTGGGASFTAIDKSRHTLFAMNETDDTISAINTRTCNGHRTSGCPLRARNEHIPFNPPQGGNPNAFALVPGTGTAYAANVGGEPFLAAVSIKQCNALTRAGCRVEAPSAPTEGTFPVLDPATDTIYAGNANGPGILVLNGATCDAADRSGCAPVATIPFAHPQANLGSIDQATHTLYASDTFSDKVSAIDIKQCNAHNTSGCNATAPKIKVGPGPNLPVLNPATHTLYVSAGKKENQIYVIDAATCNATNTSGCGQTPATITVGANSYVIDISTATDTIYDVPVDWPDNQIWVVNGASCNASGHSGCASAVVAKAKTGLDPFFVLVNDATHTVYVSNNADGDLPGTVSVINGATCNGTNTTSCSHSAPTVRVGRSPLDMAVDKSSDRIYVGDYFDAAVSSVDGSRCNAAVTSGCHISAPERAVGSQPGAIMVSHKTGTVYANTRWGTMPRFSILQSHQ